MNGRAASGVDYAVTRLHARYARLLTPAEWRVLDRVGHLAGFLQHARDGALGAWIVHFDADLGPHRIEAELRAGYLGAIAEIAHWMPRSQRAAIEWLSQLVLLPVRRHVAAEGESYPWLPSLPGRGPLPAQAQGADLLQGWLRRWRELWPTHMATAERRTLERIIGAWEAARQRIGDASRAQGEGDALALEVELRRRFRHACGALDAACAYLGLLWLQTLRLRGALLRRRLVALRDGLPA